MSNIPPRKRGRPSKADLAAREEAKKAEAESLEAKQNAYLDEILSKPAKARGVKLVESEETIRIIYELAKIGATQNEIGAVLGVAASTLRDFLAAHPNCREAWEDGIEHAKISLRRKQLSLADKNAPMAIFLGKNMLGQKDEHHTNLNVSKPANEMSEEELLDIAERGKAKKPEAKEARVLN